MANELTKVEEELKSMVSNEIKRFKLELRLSKQGTFKLIDSIWPFNMELGEKIDVILDENKCYPWCAHSELVMEIMDIFNTEIANYLYNNLIEVCERLEEEGESILGLSILRGLFYNYNIEAYSKIITL